MVQSLEEGDAENAGAESHFRRSFHVTSILRLLSYPPMKPLVMRHCHDLAELHPSGKCLSTGSQLKVDTGGKSSFLGSLFLFTVSHPEVE